MIHPSCAPIASNFVHLGLEPVVRFGWLLSPFHGEPPKLTFHQFHFGNYSDIVSLMRNLEGVPYLLSIIQATDLVVLIPA